MPGREYSHETEEGLVKAIESLTFIATMAICARLGMVYVICGCLVAYALATLIENLKDRRK